MVKLDVGGPVPTLVNDSVIVGMGMGMGIWTERILIESTADKETVLSGAKGEVEL